MEFLAYVTAFCVIFELSGAFDYCTLSKDHTMCRYQGVGDTCLVYSPEKFKSKPPNEEEKKFILDMHNDNRRKVAKGLEKRKNGRWYGQPKAADMYKMEWDDELAESAQRLAEQCLGLHDCVTCKGVPNGRYFAVGQNIAWGTSYSNDKVRYEYILPWYEKEVGLFNPRYISPFRFRSAYGHYTQVVAWRTRAIGCGAVIYNTGAKYNANLIICNYGPLGNLIRKELYSTGLPCTKCPYNTTCDDGLCVLDRNIDQRAMLPTDDYNYDSPPKHYTPPYRP